MSLRTLTGITIRIAGRLLLDNADLTIDPAASTRNPVKSAAGPSCASATLRSIRLMSS